MAEESLTEELLTENKPLFGLLDLLQLADSALPIGGQSHSFGLETLVSDGLVTPATLPDFLRGYIRETLIQDAAGAHAAYHLATRSWESEPAACVTTREWLHLNYWLAALRPARETREAGAVLGRRFLALAAEMSRSPVLAQALKASRDRGAGCQHACAFGLVGGALNLGEDATVTAYLQQSVGALLAAAQKLLPVGQHAAARLRWQLKSHLVDAVAQSRNFQHAQRPPAGFAPLLELASMRHPTAAVRLFIS